MCLICIDLAKKTLSAREARRHLGEMRVNMDKQHVAEVEAKIAEAEKEKP
jgi:hypothetical protein